MSSDQAYLKALDELRQQLEHIADALATLADESLKRQERERLTRDEIRKEQAVLSHRLKSALERMERATTDRRANELARQVEQLEDELESLQRANPWLAWEEEQPDDEAN